MRFLFREAYKRRLGNVAGSVIQYQGISFLTIKGAGHMVYDFFSWEFKYLKYSI